ncbi:MAG: N-acetylneuraminate synthase family protein [Nannocystaceae bacterium]
MLYACTSRAIPSRSRRCACADPRLADTYGDRVAAIGFSGHHVGIAPDVAAITLGAAWVERHFTLDRTGRAPTTRPRSSPTVCDGCAATSATSRAR